ncbi:hypothetical protein SAMN05428982_1644 [Pseudoxanthomonas sp. CF385]|uniref:hypothetical protein n=1 Tax=Pseudoxanthomonas sp. CF385 TaxID=1881042 RepID=UPI0008864287|nr:hypothetical protein [Pseudoxanthomonas sp. CF385]SDQ57345.1 hypothetical protein SAMN05428982_1644 [Pseudoxanthomonas sp. CF385]
MKKVLTLLVPCLVFAAAVLWWTRGDAGASSDATRPSSAALDTTSPTLASLQATPQAQAHRDRQHFEADAKDFFARAASLGAVERSERADALTRQIDAYEAAGGLSAGEALLLRTALVKATVDDPARQVEEVAAIADRYRNHADRRMAAFAAQQANDPRFQAYKTREAQVVAEVMAMTSVPAGLTRDQYLRQRLQEERERAYAP